LPISIPQEELLTKAKRAIAWRQKVNNQIRLAARKGTKTLQDQLNGLQALQKVSSQITSSLDLDQVLKTVVDASVDLTNAEEGSLLLLEEDTGELTMRASRNFNEDFVKTFRLPVKDSLVEQVLISGKPVLIEGNKPQKIVTSYLVQSILYVPLKLENRVIGVLGVDNRHNKMPFTKDHVALVSALADFAAIAIQNARLFTNIQLERTKLETFLTNIEDGVIIIDLDGRFILINRSARDLFGIHEKNITGKRVNDYLHHAELLELLDEKNYRSATRIEISIEDGRIFYAQLTPIEAIGVVVTLQDITNLKELDRIKSDFVNTVSHDLRSPLTAILGYVELIDRVGPINDQQREFIHRVQISVHNITSLINDLLDLGRIEAGFDARKEIVPLSPIIHYAIDGLRLRAQEKVQSLQIEEHGILPQVLANPVRLRQMFTNLVANSIKYTQKNGEISVIAHAEGQQVIIQVKDNGQGIPAIDQPYIFDKFYRAGNVGPDTPGTGLGLAIVKSIVENHQGRIWVDSALGEGSCFTIVLPTIHTQL
jgi:two-component system NtrC family sensor kinase